MYCDVCINDNIEVLRKMLKVLKVLNAHFCEIVYYNIIFVQIK